MFFEWDNAKKRINLIKHGVDFEDVPSMFEYPMLVLHDGRGDYEEARWVGIGWIRAFVAVVVYTERSGDVIRVISARKATREESRNYVENFQN
ncbi:BrnT family toxin [Pseudomonas sp. Marseille-P9899]|uniref:BrnT family toxin n=1 Tax=Pseudomonas sp. Marseille-P9899 TaxID=2730401 RepID=UPI00158D22EE|nr:BrnT family toxin [Pseudomonas sp. Marseille-P9899]